MLKLEGLREDMLDFQADEFSHRPSLHLRQKDGELIASQPEELSIISGSIPQPLCHANQQPITRSTTERVIDIFEAVQIDQKKRSAGLASRLKDRRQGLVERLPIAKPGQPIDARCSLKFARSAFPAKDALMQKCLPCSDSPTDRSPDKGQTKGRERRPVSEKFCREHAKTALFESGKQDDSWRNGTTNKAGKTVTQPSAKRDFN